MIDVSLQRVFQVFGLFVLELKEASEVAFYGEEKYPFPKEKELVKAQLVVELIDKYRYNPKLIRVNTLVSFGTMHQEADIIVQNSSTNPSLLFIVETPQLYDVNLENVLLRLFFIASALDNNRSLSTLVYYTRWYDEGNLHTKSLVIDYRKYPTFKKWQEQGRPSQKSIPANAS